MKFDTYIINSPKYPGKGDFDRFSVWCEWDDSEEVPFLKSICESSEEYEELIVAPYELGKETYYPIPSLVELPSRRYCLIRVSVQIGDVKSLGGYVSTSEGEVVSITIWPTKDEDLEITLYKYDRLVAEDENPENIKQLSSLLDTASFNGLTYSSRYVLGNGAKVKGLLRCL